MLPIVASEAVRKQIDAIKLNPRLQRLRDRYFEEAPQVDASRLKFAVDAWKASEGDHIEVRYAKKLKAILQGIPIVIHDG